MVDGSVQQTLLDTFDCRAIFFWTNVATSGSARLKILKELRNTLTKIKNIMMTKLPPTNWVIRFWGLETSSANFSYRWTEATIPTYYRLRTESRFRNASEFTLDLAHSIWRLLELASNPTKNIRGQHFPKGVSQTVEEFWSDDSWQFTKLSNGFHKVAQQPGPTWFLSNIALAYCNLQERPDPDSLGLTSQITDVSTNCVPNYSFFRGRNKTTVTNSSSIPDYRSAVQDGLSQIRFNNWKQYTDHQVTIVCQRALLECHYHHVCISKSD